MDRTLPLAILFGLMVGPFAGMEKYRFGGLFDRGAGITDQAVFLIGPSGDRLPSE